MPTNRRKGSERALPTRSSRRKGAAHDGSRALSAGLDRGAVGVVSAIHGTPEACAERLEQLRDKFLGDLGFLLEEFDKLEKLVVPPELEGKGEAANTDSKLGRLRFFTNHVSRTMDRMQAARSGSDPLSMLQLALLEEHIETSIIPVKARLVRQFNGGSLATLLRADVTSGCSEVVSSTSSCAGSIQGEVSADGGSTSRSSSISSSMGGLNGSSLSRDSGGEEEWESSLGAGGGDGDAGDVVGMELTDEIFGFSMDVASSSRTASGTTEGQALLAVGAVEQEYFGSPSPPPGRGGDGGSAVGGRLAQHRRDQVDLLSQLEAEGVFAADDSYSLCRAGLRGDVFPIASGPVEKHGSDDGPAGPCELSRTIAGLNNSDERDVEGLQSHQAEKRSEEYFNPSVVKQELCDGTPVASGTTIPFTSQYLPAFMGSRQKKMTTSAPSSTDISSSISSVRHPPPKEKQVPAPTSSYIQPKCELISLPTVAVVAGHSSNSVCSPSDVIRKIPQAVPLSTFLLSTALRSKETTKLVPDAAMAEKKDRASPASGFERSAPTSPVFPTVIEPRVTSACVTSVSVTSADSTTRTTTVTCGEQLRCGFYAPRAVDCEKATTSATAATGNNTTAVVVSGGDFSGIPPKQLSSGGGGEKGKGGMLLMPPRPAKRRRSSAFLAALLQPREVRYQCGACSESYSATVSGNPWWLLVRQECPACHKMQIPRVDILNPTNNVEGHIAFLTEACAENGSDGDGSYMEWDGETSEENSDDDCSGDEGYSRGSSIGNLTGGGEGGEGGRDGAREASLSSEQAAKLLVLMCHARACPGSHRSPRLAEVCRSVKFLMLHLRDCDGRTRAGQPCPLPWCQPCTSLLHHLIQCPESARCQVCNPNNLPAPLRDLRALNHSGSAQHVTVLQAPAAATTTTTGQQDSRASPTTQQQASPAPSCHRTHDRTMQ